MDRKLYMREYMKDWRNKNRERFNQIIYKYKKEHSETIKNIDKKSYEKRKNTFDYKYKKYKYGAQKRGLEFSLTKEQFEFYWKKPCYYCGSKIETIGIDRKDNNIGYKIDNCIPCCWRCNKVKGNASYEEFINMCIEVYNNQKSNKQSQI